jgi:hypothetical protein
MSCRQRRMKRTAGGIAFLLCKGSPMLLLLFGEIVGARSDRRYKKGGGKKMEEVLFHETPPGVIQLKV